MLQLTMIAGLAIAAAPHVTFTDPNMRPLLTEKSNPDVVMV